MKKILLSLSLLANLSLSSQAVVRVYQGSSRLVQIQNSEIDNTITEKRNYIDYYIVEKTSTGTPVAQKIIRAYNTRAGKFYKISAIDLPYWIFGRGKKSIAGYLVDPSFGITNTQTFRAGITSSELGAFQLSSGSFFESIVGPPRRLNIFEITGSARPNKQYSSTQPTYTAQNAQDSIVGFLAGKGYQLIR
jgi:hypothetical protein